MADAATGSVCYLSVLAQDYLLQALSHAIRCVRHDFLVRSKRKVEGINLNKVTLTRG